MEILYLRIAVEQGLTCTPEIPHSGPASWVRSV
jgi:hypothetical protein